ncbi:NAD-dependent epimerase [Marinilactibacillus psychrotolerans]|uniref:NAD-dependent epimerase n=1 Tax=Marinilactibacillus psychrotolerans TaxID=191770 RepID=A0A5R9C0Q6_9LACT|nr:NAD-dependent epimerase [Marinilactibacillus psychrotolerans]TLQ06259.1 NAD-dependent epimerase [Marinilactibacillus psychrotolerans]
MLTILVTGAAGFIGMHLSVRLLEEGHTVVGFDNLNNYYDIQLKRDRVDILKPYENFTFIEAALEDQTAVESVFKNHDIDIIINLAAQAGVRYSIENPRAYIDSNVIGFINILEAARHNDVKHVIYASSSSVYGANVKMPFSTDDAVDHPVSLYAATKKSNELMAHTYSHLYNIPTTGLRFFTVYGPMGRPDMAYFSFTNKILAGDTIKIFNNGDMMRDFTYIDDIVDGIIRLLDKAPVSNPAYDREHPTPKESYAPYKVYNIGNNTPVQLLDFVKILEKHLGVEADKEFLPMQPGDVKATFADIEDLNKATGFKPTTSIETGLGEFVEWYKDYYNI